MKRTALVLGFLFSMSAAHAFELTPGEWQTTTKINAPGMPEGMATQVHTNCLSADQASNPEKALRNGMKEGDCGLPEAKSSGDTMKWTMTCTIPGSDSKTHMSGEMVKHSDKHYSQVMTVKGNNHSITTNTEAKWLGPCKK